MSNYASGTGPVMIRGKDLEAAVKVLQTEEFVNANDKKISVKKYLSWAKVNMDSIEDILSLCGFTMEFDVGGNLVSVDYESENYHSDDVMVLALLAKFMEPGSHLDMRDDFHFWRWIFDSKAKNGCLYEDGTVVFPSDGIGHVENIENEGAVWKKDLHLLPDAYVTLHLVDGTSVSGQVYEIDYDRQRHTMKTVDIVLPNDKIRTIRYEEIVSRDY